MELLPLWGAGRAAGGLRVGNLQPVGQRNLSAAGAPSAEQPSQLAPARGDTDTAVTSPSDRVTAQGHFPSATGSLAGVAGVAVRGLWLSFNPSCYRRNIWDGSI